MAVSPGRAAAAAFTGDVGLEEDEARSFALAPRLNQLISASCRRLAERKHTPGGRALGSSAAPPLKYPTSTTFYFLNSIIVFWIVCIRRDQMRIHK